MADLVVTANSVVAGANASKEKGVAGEVIAAGKAVYKASSGKYMLADNNSATPAQRQARGIALNGAALDQPLEIQKSGDITIGAVLTPGLAYYLSDTPGGICPVGDVGAGEFVCLIGTAKSAAVLTIGIQFPNVSN